MNEYLNECDSKDNSQCEIMSPSETVSVMLGHCLWVE